MRRNNNSRSWKVKNFCLHLSLLILFAGCDGDRRQIGHDPKPQAVGGSVVAAPTPLPKSSNPAPTPKNGDYPGRGKVTKINNELGSVELDHEDIQGLMPPMIMEFYVSDKKLLKGLTVGDAVNFTVRNKDNTETIVQIEKAK